MNEVGHHRAFAALLAGAPPNLETERGEFVAWLKRHQLAPYAHLLAKGIDEPLRDELRGSRLGNCAVMTWKETVFLRVLRACTAQGATPIVFKGWGVAHLYYPSIDLRPVGDIDLLFAEADLEGALAAAQSLGFRLMKDDPSILRYYREDSYNVPVVHPEHGLFEIHHALYRDCEPSFVQGLISRAQAAEVLGVPVRTPRPVDLFLVLAVHWTESDPGARWLWLLDLCLIGRELKASDWDELAATARKHGLEVFVVAVWRTLQSLWEIRFPAAERASQQLSEALTIAERYGLEALAEVPYGRRQTGNRICLARRLSGRPIRGRGLSASLIAHPGAVCLDLGVSSSSEHFWWHRVRHAYGRITKLGAALMARTPLPVAPSTADRGGPPSPNKSFRP